MTNNIALGHAINSKELFENFPYKKLDFTCADALNTVGDLHRDVVVRRIFTDCVEMVINDIIDNNITFCLPTSGRRCEMHALRIEGERFKHGRLHGKWLDIDFLKSFNSAYLIVIDMFGKKKRKTKYIYIDKKLNLKLTDNINNGMKYC